MGKVKLFTSYEAFSVVYDDEEELQAIVAFTEEGWHRWLEDLEGHDFPLAKIKVAILIDESKIEDYGLDDGGFLIHELDCIEIYKNPVMERFFPYLKYIETE